MSSIISNKVTTCKVTAYICTRNREDSTLALAIQSVLTQSYPVSQLIIYDDGSHKDLRAIPHYANLFAMMQRKGIDWSVEFSNNKGQVCNHRRALNQAKHPFIWRIDDDDVAEPNVLRLLMDFIHQPGVGAVGGLVLDPTRNMVMPEMASNKIEDIYLGLNRQWFKYDDEVVSQEVDHLYSTFLYRKEAAKPEYYPELSRVGHREETIFTYSMKRAGWRLLVNPTAITWHLKQPSGGIRDGYKEMWELDEMKFKELLKKWKVKPTEYKIITLDNGLGDHYVFKKILPQVKKMYPQLVMAVCFPQVFKGERLISIAEAKMMGTTDNIYKYMVETNNKGSLEEAYRRYYL